jgi:hypothetical protein
MPVGLVSRGSVSLLFALIKDEPIEPVGAGGDSKGGGAIYAPMRIGGTALAFGNPFALVPDLADQTSVLTIEGDGSNIQGGLEDKLSEIERLHAERVMRLAKRYAKADAERALEA